MEMFDGFVFRTTMLSMMKTYLVDDQAMQMVSAHDIGWFAAEAFDHPETNVGHAIEIAGDFITRKQAMDALRRAGRGPVIAFTIPKILRGKLPEDFRLMFEWIAREGFRGNLPALRRTHPGLLTLPSWTAMPAAA